MAPSTPITPKNQRKCLSNAEKQKIIEESKKLGFCRKKTMEKYGIGRSVICNILKNQKEIYFNHCYHIKIPDYFH